MVIKRLSCVFRLTDGCMNRPLFGSEAALYSGGVKLHHEYKTGGFFVVNDLPAGEYSITILALGYQRETVNVTVSEEVAGNGLAQVNYIALNPSAEHPAAVRMASVSGTAPEYDTLYVVRPVGNMRVAEDSVSAGSSEIRSGSTSSLDDTSKALAEELHSNTGLEDMETGAGTSLRATGSAVNTNNLPKSKAPAAPAKKWWQFCK